MHKNLIIHLKETVSSSYGFFEVDEVFEHFI